VQAHRFFLVLKGRYLAISLPELHIVPVNQFLGPLDGNPIIVQSQIYATEHTPALVNHICVVSIHGSLSRSPPELTKRAAFCFEHNYYAMFSQFENVH